MPKKIMSSVRLEDVSGIPILINEAGISKTRFLKKMPKDLLLQFYKELGDFGMQVWAMQMQVSQIMRLMALAEKPTRKSKKKTSKIRG
jgi:hypothetical protein